MVRTIIDLPEDLHRQLDEQARLRGVTVGDYVRDLLESRTSRRRPPDPMLDDDYRFEGPPDLTRRLDDYAGEDL